jgi:large subunit ribosomal protein L25
MSEVTLEAQVGREIGSATTRRLRREGKIPGVIYGHGTEPLPIAVDGPALRVALSGEAGLNQLLTIKADGREILAMARDLQRHPVRNNVTHIDFLVVDRDEKVTVEVTLTIIGDAVDVRHADGTVDQQVFAINVIARPADIPTMIEVDISKLNIGENIKVGEVILPPGVEHGSDLEMAIVTANSARAVVEASTEGEDAAEAAATAAAAPEAAASAE